MGAPLRACHLRGHLAVVEVHMKPRPTKAKVHERNLTRVNPAFPSYQDDGPEPLRTAAYEGYGVTSPASPRYGRATRLQHDWCWLTKFFYRNGGDDGAVGVCERVDTVYYAGTVSGPGTNWTTNNGTRVVMVDIRDFARLTLDAVVDFRDEED
jgi:hypothetical protein